MASKEFSNKLKDLRLKAGYSQKNVYEHFNIPQSTFSSWEIGKSEPSGEMLLKLCEFYKCDLMKEFSSDNNLTYKEWNMIEKYRSLDDFGKDTVNIIIERELNRTENINEIKSSFSKLECNNVYDEAPDTPEELERLYPPIDINKFNSRTG